jgi:hypothetical protein
MQTSILIAKLIGPIVLVAAIVMLANTRDLQELARGFLEDRPLIYLSGILALLAGLAIVNTHNVWTLDWPVIITIIGWASIVGGIARMALPKVVASVGGAMLQNRALIQGSGAVWVLIGGWLCYAGYLS